MTAAERRLLAGLSRWRKDKNWTDSNLGWVDAAQSVRVRPLEHGFKVWGRYDDQWRAEGEFPATSIRQAVDILVALTVLPAPFSSAYEAGWHDGYFHTAEDETAVEIKASWATDAPSNPDRRCRSCGATSGLVLLPGNPLTGAGRAHECADGCKAATR